MSEGYTPEQRRAIASALSAGDAAPPCPACGARLRGQPVHPGPGVPYVRTRTWVLCPQCRRSASVDVNTG